MTLPKRPAALFVLLSAGLLLLSVPVPVGRAGDGSASGEMPAIAHDSSITQPRLTIFDEPVMHEPRHHQAPAPFRARVSSPPLPIGMRTRNGYVSVQVNVDANGDNIVDDAANEPSIAIDPTDPNRIVVGWRQFDSITSNFRQAGWGYSHDGGQTWTFPGVLDPGAFRSDPVLAADSHGAFYYSSLDENFYCQMFKSLDGGVTWSPPIPMYGGDKQWLAIDPTPGDNQDNLYANWSLGPYGYEFTRSFNEGASFEGPFPMSPTVWGTLTVAPDGTVYIAGTVWPSTNPTPIHLSWSTNAFDPNGVPTFGERSLNLGGPYAAWGGPNPGGLPGQVWIGSDHSGGPTHGNLYVLSSVQGSGADPLDVKIICSTNGGSTWSAPVRVNDDPSGTRAWQWFGTLSVAPNGRLDAVWNDTRNDPYSPMFPTQSEVYYACSTDAGQTWSRNIPVTYPWNHFDGYPQQPKIGDYYHMISDNAEVRLVYSATLNGQQDIYFVRIGDCNHNGVHDAVDIATGTSTDIDENGEPDDCQDCDGDGVLDPVEILNGTALDCNHNYVPDGCDIVSGLETDCNANGAPDDCDVASGTSPDCNGNDFPDECDVASGFSGDCNSNNIPDECDIANGTAPDCNGNLVPDQCDVAAGYSPDCNSNGIPDSCDIASGFSSDCNGNGVPDTCDFPNGTALDCNENGVPDECDVAAHYSNDCNQNGLPDECESGTQSGLAGAYYGNQDLAGVPRGRLDPLVQFDWGTGAPWADYRVDHFSVRWSGYVRTPAIDGDYTFFTFTDDGVRLWIAGQLVIDHWTDQLPTEWSATIALSGGREYPVVMEYYEATGPSVAELRWQPPGEPKSVVPTASLLPAADCDGDGISDACSFDTHYAATSPRLSPLGGTAHDFLLLAPPDATGEATLSFSAFGDLNYASEYIDVELNGAYVGTVYTGPYEDCVPGQEDSLTMTAETYNALKAGGNVLARVIPSEGVYPEQCAPETSYIYVSIAYDSAPASFDCNGNGIPDSCDVAGGWSVDLNGNGVPDECDVPSTCRGDCNCDRRVGFRDIDLFVAAMQDNEANWAAQYHQYHGFQPPAGCWENCDVNGNGTHAGADDIDTFVILIPSACPD